MKQLYFLQHKEECNRKIFQKKQVTEVGGKMSEIYKKINFSYLSKHKSLYMMKY